MGFGGQQEKSIDLQKFALTIKESLPTTNENIIGVGVDICSVSRMQKDIERNPLLAQQICNPQEIAYCDQATGVIRAQLYAFHFAGKEAVAKAIGGIPHSFMDISIRVNKDAKPEVELHGKAKKQVDEVGIDTLSLFFFPLSHREEEYVIAFCTAKRNSS